MSGSTLPLRLALIVCAVALAAACGPTAAGDAGLPDDPPAVPVETAQAIERSIPRFVSVTGTLTPRERADVAAEVAGRVVSTLVERGTPVREGAELVRISATEVEAQAREAEANAAQIHARLGGPSSEEFDLDSVPEVASARAARDLAQGEFERAQALFERRLVPQAEFDERRARADSAQRQYETARNTAEQQRQALAAARARVELARKALADTVVRAPFAGVVAERAVSVGDYVTRGTRVASVMSVNPLRLELTVPAQHLAAVAVGRRVSLEVDAYPGETFTGQLRYISPGVQPDSRALVVEAVVPNDDGRLKPGLFVTARIEQTSPSPGVLVPAEAIYTTSGTSRVFVVVDGEVEERLVTTGATVDGLVEITTGVRAGEVVAVSSVATLVDGARVALQ